jgi:outer membrane protein assembly factor BamB
MPRPHPEPTVRTRRVDTTPPPLTPVETVWGLALNNALVAPPAFDGTQAFFSLEGDRFVAYDLISGTRQWMITARPTMAPVAGGGLIYMIDAATLKAIRTADGSVAWELPFADALAVHPVWDNGWLILAAASGEVRALRATDGEQIWRRDLGSPAHAAPALAADRVYIPTTDHRIVALRVENGERVWERMLGGAPNEILALDERLFVGSLDNFFYCIMANDGGVDWRWRTGGDIIGRPVSDNRYVYFVSFDNVLRAMNQVSGGQQWIRPLPIRPAWAPVKAGTTIVVSGDSATLRAFNAKDGVASGTFTGVAPQPEFSGEAPPSGDAKDKKPLTFNPLEPDARVVAVPYALEHPLTHAPLIVVVFSDIAKGASATLLMHSFEPAIIDKVAQLPNLVQIAPVTPTTPPPRN